MLNKTLKIVKGILYWLHSVTISLLALCALIIVVLYVVGMRLYAVQTGSMEPAIPVNSICLVNQKYPFENIVDGDVIAFRVGEHTMVTHRVVRIEDGLLVTQGDANNSEDASPVSADNYVGKTIYSIPRIGFVVRFLHTVPGICLAVMMFLFLLALNFLLDKPKIDDENTK